MKKVISFSLWGTNPKYTVGAVENAVLAKSIFPDWICRFYVGKSTIIGDPSTIRQLESLDNVEIVEMNEEGDWTGMFWRFMPCIDSDVEYMLSRDCDSRLTYREKSAVDDWIKSKKDFHIIRDHPLHLYKILGGLWGAKYPVLSNIDILIAAFTKGNYWNVDQEFLGDIVFPLIKNKALVHDQFLGLRSISKKRQGDEFIGEVYDGNNLPDYAQRKILRDAIVQNNKLSIQLKRQISKAWRRLKGNPS